MHVTLKNYKWFSNKSFIFRASVRFVIPTTVTITNTVYWDVTPVTLIDKYLVFGEISCLRLQGALVIFQKNNRWQLYKLINMKWTHSLQAIQRSVKDCVFSILCSRAEFRPVFLSKGFVFLP